MVSMILAVSRICVRNGHGTVFADGTIKGFNQNFKPNIHMKVAVQK